MKWVYDDGGREDAGYRGYAEDCCVRSIAIALNLPYKEVYDTVNKISKSENYRGRNRKGNGISNSRTGVYTGTMHKIMKHYGWEWVPTMQFGKGCHTHLRDGEVPDNVPIICNVSKHFVAVVNGVIHDTYDPSREGTRCVYGYWRKA